MIPEYKSILLATDLTANAARAFRHAVGLARAHGARVTLLHVLADVNPAVLHDVSAVMGEEVLAGFEREHKEEIRRQIVDRLEAFAREELADHPEDRQRLGGIEVHHGSPVAVILETAERLGADLIVLGSHGKGRLKHALLGSVAEKVLRRSTRPVLVVPLI